VHRHDFPANDYQHILIAFDDEQGEKINHRYITDNQLTHFMETGNPIHYEEFFLVEKEPSKVVFWAYSNERGWCERIEQTISK
jgi:hypothetical protein